jgi:hypothetical protein
MNVILHVNSMEDFSALKRLALAGGNDLHIKERRLGSPGQL